MTHVGHMTSHFSSVCKVRDKRVGEEINLRKKSNQEEKKERKEREKRKRERKIRVVLRRSDDRNSSDKEVKFVYVTRVMLQDVGFFLLLFISNLRCCF